MQITDIQNMPNYNSAVPNGRDSVTRKVVFLVQYVFGVYPHCRAHGALLKVSECLWRCPSCNEGCYQLPEVS